MRVGFRYLSLTYLEALICINPSEKSVDNSLSSMNFAIKTSSISKKTFADGNTRSAAELTPIKQTEYIERLESRVSSLENENSVLRKEIEFLKNRLNKSYGRGAGRTGKALQGKNMEESQRVS